MAGTEMGASFLGGIPILVDFEEKPKGDQPLFSRGSYLKNTPIQAQIAKGLEFSWDLPQTAMREVAVHGADWRRHLRKTGRQPFENQHVSGGHLGK